MNIILIVRNLNTFGGNQKQMLRIGEQLSLSGNNVKILTNKIASERLLGVDKKLEILVTNFDYQSLNNDSDKIRGLILSADWILFVDNDLIYLKKIFPNKKFCWICNDAPHSHSPFIHSNNILFAIRNFITGNIYRLKKHSEIKSLDKIIVLDTKMEKAVYRNYKKYSAVIRSGIDKIEFNLNTGVFPELKDKFNIEKKKYILAIGIAAPYRNFEIFAKIAESIPKDLKILIVAPNHYNNHYSKKLIQIFSNKKNVIHYYDFISETEKYSLLKNALVFVFPNRDQTWGLAPLEALSVKTPIIVSDECGITEVLTDGNDCLIFNPRNSNELVSKIKIIYDDAKFGEYLAEKGLNLVNNKLTWSNYSNEIIKYLNSGIK